jgi:hypothetical protein
MKSLSIACGFALALVLLHNPDAEAKRQDGTAKMQRPIKQGERGHKDGRGQPGRHGNYGRQKNGSIGVLNSEQRIRLKERVNSLRESGASAETIANAMGDEYTAAGIDLPENFTERATQREIRRAERQVHKDAARNLVENMKAEGASRGQIHEALREAGLGKTRRDRRSGHRGDISDRAAPAPTTPNKTNSSEE